MHFTTTAILTTALALSASALPSVNKRYVPGWCGAHIQQFQKNEGPGPNTADYRFTIELKDANGAPIGGANTAPVANGQSLDIDSELPDVFVVTAGFVDNDPVTFAYAGQHWDSSSSQCSFGAYDSGSRQGDCGFTC